MDLGLTIWDPQTGLEWEKKNADDAVQDASNLHDVDNLYTWCAATGSSASVPIWRGTWDACVGNTESWIASVNAEFFAGFNDWFVPRAGTCSGCLGEGLQTIWSPVSEVRALDPIFGPTLQDCYWSTEVHGAGPVARYFIGAGSIQWDIPRPEHLCGVRAARFRGPQ